VPPPQEDWQGSPLTSLLLQHGRGRGKTPLDSPLSTGPRRPMSKNLFHFAANAACTVAVGGNFLPLHLRYGLSLPCPVPYRRQARDDSLRACTVAVGGKHGRGRGKTRSRSGENTVAVGGKFTLEICTVAVARSADSCTCVLCRSPVSSGRNDSPLIAESQGYFLFPITMVCFAKPHHTVEFAATRENR